MGENVLVEMWRRVDLSKPPYCFLDDTDKIIKENKSFLFNTYNECVNNFDAVKDHPKRLHLGLIPVPFLGNLKMAKIFILTANPGFIVTDYEDEFENRKFRELLINNLRQENLGEYPFSSLNPEFAWTGGFKYWSEKLGDIIEELIRANHLRYFQALRYLSQLIAVLEYIPYHSEIDPGIYNLPSSDAIKNYVIDTLVPRAKSNEIIIVIIRKVKEWGLTETHNVILYDPGQSRWKFR